MLIYFYVLWILAYITVYDILNYRIPNRLLLLLIPAGFYILSPGSAIFGAHRIIAALFILGLLRLFHMNGGDCKLAAVSVLLLGLTPFLYAFLVMGLSAALYTLSRFLISQISCREPIPLGPFMNLGTVLFFCIQYHTMF